MRVSNKRSRPALAVALSNARRVLGHEQTEMAKVLGVSSRSVSRWETGEAVPHRDYHAPILRTCAGLPPPQLRELTVLLVGVDPGLRGAGEGATLKQLLDTLVYRAAEDLDVSPARVRTVFARAFEALRDAGADPAAALGALGAASSAKK